MEGSGYRQSRQSNSPRASSAQQKILHEDIVAEILVWRIVLEKIATLEEIERSWSLNDLYIAEAILDYREDLISEAKRKAKEK